jgi:hypothetical protein
MSFGPASRPATLEYRQQRPVPQNSGRGPEIRDSGRIVREEGAPRHSWRLDDGVLVIGVLALADLIAISALLILLAWITETLP